MHTPAPHRLQHALLALAACTAAVVAAPSLAHADDVVLDRAAWTRTLNAAQDLLSDFDRALTKTPKLHPSDRLKLHGDRIRVEERMRTLTKTLGRGAMDPKGVRLDRAHLSEDLNDALAATKLLGRDLQTTPITPQERDKLTRRADSVRDQLSALQNALRALPRAPSRPSADRPAKPTRPGRRHTPMRADRFRDLTQQLARATFSSRREALVVSAARDNHFTTQQCIAILRAFVHESDKADIGVILHPRVTDPENWHKVYGEFTFDSYRKSLQGRVELD